MKLKQSKCILFLFSFVFLSPDYSYAQFEKGHKVIGGNFGFSYSDHSHGEHYYKNGYFRVSPTFGYFLSEKSMWGFSPTVSLSHNNASYQLEPGNQWGLGTSVFYRRFFKATEQFHFFLEPSVGYQGTINS